MCEIYKYKLIIFFHNNNLPLVPWNLQSARQSWNALVRPIDHLVDGKSVRNVTPWCCYVRSVQQIVKLTLHANARRLLKFLICMYGLHLHVDWQVQLKKKWKKIKLQLKPFACRIEFWRWNNSRRWQWKWKRKRIVFFLWQVIGSACNLNIVYKLGKSVKLKKKVLKIVFFYFVDLALFGVNNETIQQRLVCITILI